MKLLLVGIMLLLSTSVFAENFYANKQQAFTATTTSTKFVNGNGKRNYLLMVNNGAVAVLVKFGSAHTGSEGVSIAAGGYYEPSVAPRDSIYMKTGSSTSSVYILEGVSQQ